jgi:hypothetical protein
MSRKYTKGSVKNGKMRFSNCLASDEITTCGYRTFWDPLEIRCFGFGLVWNGLG